MTIKLKVMSAVDLSLTNHSILCEYISLPGSGTMVLNKCEPFIQDIENLRNVESFYLFY